MFSSSMPANDLAAKKPTQLSLSPIFSTSIDVNSPLPRLDKPEAAASLNCIELSSSKPSNILPTRSSLNNAIFLVSWMRTASSFSSFIAFDKYSNAFSSLIKHILQQDEF